MQALTLLENSLDALKKCPAYTALPADKYDEWRVLDLHFTPNGISTATPAPRCTQCCAARLSPRAPRFHLFRRAVDCRHSTARPHHV